MRVHASVCGRAYEHVWALRVSAPCERVRVSELCGVRDQPLRVTDPPFLPIECPLCSLMSMKAKMRTAAGTVFRAVLLALQPRVEATRKNLY